LKKGNSQKSIRVEGKCPEALNQLIKEMEKVINAEGWLKAPENSR